MPPSSPSSGAWTYISSDPRVIAISGNAATIAGVGAATITASQAASGNYASTSISANVTVTAATPTLGAFALLTKTLGAAAFTLTPPTSTSSGAWIYSSGNTAVATVTGNTVTIRGVGNAVITATQAANGNYTGASTTATLTVMAATPTLGAFTVPAKTFGAAAFTLTPPTSTSSGAWIYSSGNTAVATVSGNTVTIRGVGNAVITATQAANGNYSRATKTATLTVR